MSPYECVYVAVAVRVAPAATSTAYQSLFRRFTTRLL